MNDWASVIISIALGVWTHIAWDGFTHADGFGTELMPALATPWLIVWGQTLPGYKVLQYGSSVVGLPILGVVVARWYGRQRSTDERAIAAASRARRVLAITLLLGAPLVAVAVSLCCVPRAEPGFARLFVYEVVTRTIATYLVGIVALTLPQRGSRIDVMRSGPL